MCLINILSACYELLQQCCYLPPPPQNGEKLQKPGRVVSSRKRKNVFNKHIASLLWAFATMLLLTTSPQNGEKLQKPGRVVSSGNGKMIGAAEQPFLCAKSVWRTTFNGARP
jgi:hypothetical protein